MTDKVKPESILKMKFPADVVKVYDDNNKVVINRGTDHGVKLGQRFLIYAIEEEIIDPSSGESLGNLEVVKGKGIVFHVQEKMAHIKSNEIAKEKTIKRSSNSMWKYLGDSEEEIITPTVVPFEDPRIGDKAKPI